MKFSLVWSNLDFFFSKLNGSNPSQIKLNLFDDEQVLKILKCIFIFTLVLFQGDSGGPLLHHSYDGSWTILGVVSFGYKCGTPGVPGIYTRVSYYLNWIFNAMDIYYTSL